MTMLAQFLVGYCTNPSQALFREPINGIAPWSLLSTVNGVADLPSEQFDGLRITVPCNLGCTGYFFMKY